MDDPNADAELFDDDDGEDKPPTRLHLRNAVDFTARAAETYEQYANQFKSRFKWLRPDLFIKSLGTDLENDADSLLDVLKRAGDWNPAKDAKLDALHDLLTKDHPNEKVLVFSQFADTVRYLSHELRLRGVKTIAGVTGQSEDPTDYAWRFSPNSNHKRNTIMSADELRVLIATDVLSEGRTALPGDVASPTWPDLLAVGRVPAPRTRSFFAASLDLNFGCWPSKSAFNVITRIRFWATP